MPLTPGITLTATLQDVSGNDDSASSLVVALAGFGANLPRIVGTSMLAKVGPFLVPLANGIETALLLWGNDAILPAGTYYAISVVDDQGNVVQCGAYQFNGIETVDLSVAVPYVLIPPPPPPVFVDGIVPTPNPASAGISFSLPSTPVPPRCLELYYDGQVMYQGVDYTISGAALAMATPVVSPDLLLAWYRIGTPTGTTGFVDGVIPAPPGYGASSMLFLPSAPTPRLSLRLFMNGLVLTQAGLSPDYHLAGSSITLGFIPAPTDTFLAWYRD